ncbi:MAG: PAS domain S-box protein [Acetobacteraceae bacterium]
MNERLLVSSVRQHELTEQALKAEAAAARLAAIVSSSGDAIISKDLQGIILTFNKGAQRLFGYTAEEAIGKPATLLIPADRIDEEPGILERIGRGETIDQYETVRQRKDGSLIDISLTISPIRDSGDRIVGVAKIARDITERKRIETHNKLLLAEVNHRAMNLLAVVQAVVLQTAPGGDPATFVTRLSERIHGLAASQDLLVKNDWLGVEVADLVTAQLAHFENLIGTRVLLDGPPARLKSAAAQGIGMALHELATNAVKYGALSNGEGRVHITWRIVARNTAFLMSWLEEGGPSVAPPTRKGFGQTVIGRMVEAAVEGTVKVEYPESGFSWSLSAPFADTLERGRFVASAKNARE